MALQYATVAGVKARVGISNATDDAVLTTIVGQVNPGIESFCGRAIGPDPATTYTLDGHDSYEAGRCIYFSGGIRALTLLEIAPYTGQPFQTIPSTDYFVRPLVQDRDPGWPGFELWMTDIPSGSNPFPYFMPGFNNVRMSGTTLLAFGWAAVPAEVTEVAEITCVRAFQARQSGQGDVTGNDETGTAIVTAYLSGWHKRVLQRYQWKPGEII